MGQVYPDLDLRIAMVVQRELVDIEEDPQGPFNWDLVVLLGTVELGHVLQEMAKEVKWCPDRSGNNITTSWAAKLHKHVQYGILASPHIDEPSIGILQ